MSFFVGFLFLFLEFPVSIFVGFLFLFLHSLIRKKKREKGTESLMFTPLGPLYVFRHCLVCILEVFLLLLK